MGSTISSATDPAPEDGPVGAHEIDRDALAEQLYLQARRQRRDVRRLPSLLARSALLVWRTSRRDTALTVGLQLAGAAVASLQVLLASYAVKALLAGGDQISRTLLLPLVALAVVALVGSFSATASSLLGRLLSIRVERRITDEVVEVASRVELIEYEKPVFYDQLSRILSTAPSQPFQVVTSMSSLLGGAAGAAALGVTLVFLSPVLALVVLAAGPPLWWLARRGGAAEYDFMVAQTANLRERDYLQDLLTRREGAAEVRAYDTAPTLRLRFSLLYDEFIDASARLIRRRYVLAGMSAVASALTVTVALVLLYALNRSGSLGVAEAAAGLVAIRLLSARLGMLIGGAATLFQSALFLDEYHSFRTEHDAKSVTPHVAEPALNDATSPAVEVTLDGVSFSYPNSTTPAVTDVTLDIAPGKVVALVGENGSGKSTLAKLLVGLYQPDAGLVRFRDASGETVEPDVARRDITLVLQEFARYQFSAIDNIALGRADRDVDRGAAERAAGAAGVDHLIAGLPKGYDTRLSRQFAGGRDLSLGQWQRVALARAFYRNASIIVLDEPAASLDPRAEHRLYESVRQLLRDRTVVLITHRMRSVEGADRIIVLDQGRIVEDGDHSTLMDRHGAYAELVALQQAGGLQRKA